MQQWVTKQDVSNYVEQWPAGIGGRSSDLARMVNYFIERYREQQKDLEHHD